MATSKQSSKKQAASKIEAPVWNVIHVFGHGHTQVSGAGASGRVDNEGLKALEPFMTYLAGLQQKGTKITAKDLHAITILNNSFVDFSSKNEKNKSQRFAWADLNTKEIAKLADEVVKKAAPVPGLIDMAKAREAAMVAPVLPAQAKAASKAAAKPAAKKTAPKAKKAVKK